MNEELGIKIRDWREQNHMNQDKLAEKLDISRPALSLIEKGKQNITVEQLMVFSRLSGISIDSLLSIETRKVVVVDTNIFLHRPQVIKLLIDRFDNVIIPRPVICELNGIKDYGNQQQKKLASLCMNTILDFKKESKLVLEEEAQPGKIADDQIFATAKKQAKENTDDRVYMLTDDKYFRFLDMDKLPNLKTINMKEFDRSFVEETDYNIGASQKFYEVVKRGNRKEAAELVKKNIDVNMIYSATGFTPLIQAVRNRDMEMLQFLVSIPTMDLNAVDERKQNFPAITHAVQIKSIDIIQLLLASGANVNAPSKSWKNSYNTPLMVASWDGDFEIVKLLVENGACINQVDQGNGFSALIKASIQCHPNIVRYLLENGADSTIRSFAGKQAIDYAYENNANGKYEEIINLLRQR